jgi:hypothetical protein
MRSPARLSETLLGILVHEPTQLGSGWLASGEPIFVVRVRPDDPTLFANRSIIRWLVDELI